MFWKPLKCLWIRFCHLPKEILKKTVGLTGIHFVKKSVTFLFRLYIQMCGEEQSRQTCGFAYMLFGSFTGYDTGYDTGYGTGYGTGTGCIGFSGGKSYGLSGGLLQTKNIPLPFIDRGCDIFSLLAIDQVAYFLFFFHSSRNLICCWSSYSRSTESPLDFTIRHMTVVTTIPNIKIPTISGNIITPLRYMQNGQIHIFYRQSGCSTIWNHRQHLQHRIHRPDFRC